MIFGGLGIGVRDGVGLVKLQIWLKLGFDMGFGFELGLDMRFMLRFELGLGLELQESDDVITLEWPRLFFLILKSADFFVIIMIFIFNIDCIELHHSTSCLSMGIGFFQELPFCTCTNNACTHLYTIGGFCACTNNACAHLYTIGVFCTCTNYACTHLYTIRGFCTCTVCTKMMYTFFYRG